MPVPFAPLGFFAHPKFRPAMPMDAYRRDGELVIHFDMPGMDPDTIDLTVEKNVLTVSGERRFAKAESDTILVAERPHGRYRCRLELGENLDADAIKAAYENGVLTVTVPVAENAKARKIAVTTGGTQAVEGVEGEAAQAA
jgi:HSP20 family protein